MYQLRIKQSQPCNKILTNDPDNTHYHLIDNFRIDNESNKLELRCI
jgi:hypothetical protein